jgi:predicted metal-binding membrane protein
LNKVRLPADRATVLVGVTLVAVTVAAWVAFLAQAVSPTSIAMDTMSSGADLAGATGFIAAWVVMMAAMMLPSAAPLVLLYRAAGADGRVANTVPLAEELASARAASKTAYLRVPERLGCEGGATDPPRFAVSAE